MPVAQKILSFSRYAIIVSAIDIHALFRLSTGSNVRRRNVKIYQKIDTTKNPKKVDPRVEYCTYIYVDFCTVEHRRKKSPRKRVDTRLRHLRDVITFKNCPYISLDVGQIASLSKKKNTWMFLKNSFPFHCFAFTFMKEFQQF